MSLRFRRAATRLSRKAYVVLWRHVGDSAGWVLASSTALQGCYTPRRRQRPLAAEGARQWHSRVHSLSLALRSTGEQQSACALSSFSSRGSRVVDDRLSANVSLKYNICRSLGVGGWVSQEDERMIVRPPPPSEGHAHSLYLLTVLRVSRGRTCDA